METLQDSPRRKGRLLFGVALTEREERGHKRAGVPASDGLTAHRGSRSADFSLSFHVHLPIPHFLFLFDSFYQYALLFWFCWPIRFARLTLLRFSLLYACLLFYECEIANPA